jgi:hypothetical protein
VCCWCGRVRAELPGPAAAAAACMVARGPAPVTQGTCGQ